jgi:hypothetical protein
MKSYGRRMMGNFDFLLGIKEYEAFAPAAVEAEKVYATSPAMCAIGCRKGFWRVTKRAGFSSVRESR